MEDIQYGVWPRGFRLSMVLMQDECRMRRLSRHAQAAQHNGTLSLCPIPSLLRHVSLEGSVHTDESFPVSRLVGSRYDPTTGSGSS